MPWPRQLDRLLRTPQLQRPPLQPRRAPVDRVFATGIKRAYDNTSAVSGLRIINGGGRAEAQAAHIRPVHANGPDSLRSGVALSSTFHRMFDRGLISVDDDYSLLFKRNAVPGNVLSLVNPDGRLRMPEQKIHRPHRRFLEYHREVVFKGCAYQLRNTVPPRHTSAPTPPRTSRQPTGRGTSESRNHRPGTAATAGEAPCPAGTTSPTSSCSHCRWPSST